jgi:cell fate (sporulation/competence/biofilm development) regulator YlbF (YheA/YmcA/DUF963 family)
MQTTTEDTPVISKARELCETLVEQPEFKDIRSKIDTFLADDESRALYEKVMLKSQGLHQKQHEGQSISDSEIADFEKERDVLLNNPVARNFLDAQQSMQEMQAAVNKYVSKTFELGRVPEESDLECCGGHEGHGCGCSH